MQGCAAATRAASSWLLRRPYSTGPWTARRLSSTLAEHYPVAICGGGPTGLTLSALLSKFGVPSMLFERGTTLPQHPQAHYINNRTMEVFRGIGGLAEAVKARSPPLALWRKFVYCESLTGHILGSVDHFEGQEAAQTPHISPEPVAHLSQDRLAALLAEVVHSSGSTSMGHTVTSVSRMPGSGVAVCGSDVAGRPFSTRCDFFVLADGANSRLRDSLGIAMEGERAIQSLINVHFSSPSLAAQLTERPAMLYFVFNASVIAVIVAHDLTEGTFVAQVPFFPPLQSATDFTVDVCHQLLAAAIDPNKSGRGSLAADLAIHSVRPWTMHAEVAQRMRQGDVFLAGDAAHRFPPAGGFGMNTGIQDAHNLAWKLAAVLQGRAGRGLLDSYEAERRPVAVANTALSVANFHESLAVPRALGLDPRAASALQAALSSPLTSALPSGVSVALFEGGLRLGRRLGAPSTGPLAAWRQARLAKLFDGGATLRLQYPKEDLGFVYSGSGAVCAEPKEVGRAAAGPTGNRDAPYVPTTAPGARLPHAWLTAEGSEQVPTLDLVDRCCGRTPALLLILGNPECARSWSAAAASLEALPLQICHIVSAVDAAAATGDKSSGKVGSGGTDRRRPATIPTFVDADGQWQRVREVSEEGVLLVRPDGHVAWRSSGGASSDHCVQQLRAAVAQIMCLYCSTL